MILILAKPFEKHIIIIFGLFFVTLLCWRSIYAGQDGQGIILQGHTDGVRSVAFSSDGKYMISGGHDQKLLLWKTAGWKPVRVLLKNEEPIDFSEKYPAKDVMSVAFSPDSQYIAAGLRDNTVRLFDVQSGEQVKVLEGNTRGLRSVAFSPDGQYIVSGGHDGIIRLWEVKSGRSVRVFTGHMGQVWSVAFSPDGHHVVSSGFDDGSIRLWDVETGQEVLKLKHGNSAISVAFSSKGKYLASAGSDIRLWELGNWRLIKVFRPKNSLECFAISPDGVLIVSGNVRGSLELWNVATGKVIREFKGTNESVLSVAFTPDGRHIASGFYDGTIRIWHVDSGSQIKLSTRSQ